MNQIEAFFALSLAEKRLRLEAFVWLWLIRVMLWLLPFRLWSAIARRLKMIQRPAAPLDDAAIDRIGYSVRRMHTFVPQATCLTQALTLQILLARRKQESDLKVGVAPNLSGKLEAHAWVVIDGRVVIGDNRRLTQYALFPHADHF